MPGKRKAQKSSYSKRAHRRRKSRMRSPADKKTIPTVSKGKDTQKEVQKVTRKPVTGWRLWLFRIVALTVIPALMFLLIELGLRVAGYGFPATAIIKCEVNGKEFYSSNVKFGWRFFPRNLAREPESFIFPADKSDNTYRIFILGSSAAQGTPDAAFSFGRFLRVMLREQYPGVNFEVISTAMTAINSHVVLEMAKDCANHRPDLFIVYLGNNEVVGPYGAGTVFAPLSPHLFLIRAGIALKATRLGQLLTNLLEMADAGRDKPAAWRGMEMFLEKQVPMGDQSLKTVYRHFERNLKDIGRIAGESGAKTIFCTVGSNLKDCPPFASLHRPTLTEADRKQWDEIYRQGVTYEAANNYGEAVTRYLAAAEVDDYYADMQFRLGRCYWAIGEYGKARQRYIRARELDTLRFRADNKINETILAVIGNKAARGVYLVDAVNIFEKNSPHEVTGEELFYEHVHLNFKGNYLLAKIISEHVEDILPEWIRAQKDDKGQLLTEAECAQRLAYTDWDRYKIAVEILNEFIKEVPFTNQLYHKEQVRLTEEKLQVLKGNVIAAGLERAAAQYRLAIQHENADWWLHLKYAHLLDEMEYIETAVKEYRWAIEHSPNYYLAYAKLGRLLGMVNDLDGAIAHNLEAIQIMPTCPDAHFNLGFAYQMQDRVDKAIEHYSKALQFQPYHAQAYNNLGILLYRRGKVDEAVQTYRRGLAFVPDNLDLHYNLGIVLGKRGLLDEAVKELRAALKIDPNSAKAHKVLKAILERDRQSTKTPKRK